MYTLGIDAVYHDSAAALVKDRVVIAAAKDERFTHVKHAKRPVPFSTWQLPFDAIDYCLATAGIVLAEVDHLAYSYDPRLLLGNLGHAPPSSCRSNPRAFRRVIRTARHGIRSFSRMWSTRPAS